MTYGVSRLVSSKAAQQITNRNISRVRQRNPSHSHFFPQSPNFSIAPPYTHTHLHTSRPPGNRSTEMAHTQCLSLSLTHLSYLTGIECAEVSSQKCVCVSIILPHRTVLLRNRPARAAAATVPYILYTRRYTPHREEEEERYVYTRARTEGRRESTVALVTYGLWMYISRAPATNVTAYIFFIYKCVHTHARTIYMWKRLLHYMPSVVVLKADKERYKLGSFVNGGCGKLYLII